MDLRFVTSHETPRLSSSNEQQIPHSSTPTRAESAFIGAPDPLGMTIPFEACTATLRSPDLYCTITAPVICG